MPAAEAKEIPVIVRECAAALNDFVKARKRAAASVHLDTKPELANNIWPALETLAESLIDLGRSCHEAFSEFGEEIAVLKDDESGSIIEAPLAAQIFAHITMGRTLAEKVKALKLDDLKAREMNTLADAYLKSSGVLEVAIGEVAEEIEGDGEEGAESEEDADPDDIADDLTGTDAAPANDTPPEVA